MYTACARMPNKPYVDEDEDEGEGWRGDKNRIHAGRGSHTTSTCPIASRGYQTHRGRSRHDCTAMRRYDIYERRNVSDKTRVDEDGTGPDELESGYDKIRKRERRINAREH